MPYITWQVCFNNRGRRMGLVPTNTLPNMLTAARSAWGYGSYIFKPYNAEEAGQWSEDNNSTS